MRVSVAADPATYPRWAGISAFEPGNVSTSDLTFLTETTSAGSCSRREGLVPAARSRLRLTLPAMATRNRGISGRRVATASSLHYSVV